MIHTYAIQEIITENWIGFSIKETGGMIRILEYKLRRQGIKITARDIVDSLHYMVSREWVEAIGLWGRDKIYRVTPKETQRSRRQP